MLGWVVLGMFWEGGGGKKKNSPRDRYSTSPFLSLFTSNPPKSQKNPKKKTTQIISPMRHDIQHIILAVIGKSSIPVTVTVWHGGGREGSDLVWFDLVLHVEMVQGAAVFFWGGNFTIGGF